MDAVERLIQVSEAIDIVRRVDKILAIVEPLLHLPLENDERQMLRQAIALELVESGRKQN